jgi:hypothetical protein
MTAHQTLSTTRSDTTESESTTPWTLLRLRVTTDGDPGVLPRLLGYLQNLNVTPRSVVAEFDIKSLMHLQIDVAGLPGERLTLIAGKIGQSPCVLNAYWHYL